MKSTVHLPDIRINGGTQSRAAINPQVVSDYAEALATGAEFPPVVVFFDGSTYWLADGFHRYEAYARTNADTIPADVRQGTQRDAILYSVGANSLHGLRRTNDDKRRAVLTLLNDAEWSKWPQRKIAEACGVTREFVSRVGKDASCDRSQDTVREVTRGGATYQQDTANIGKRAVRAPDPAPAPIVAEDLEAEIPAADLAPAADAERRKLAKMTTDGLIDEVIGLRADLADAKAKAKAQAAEIKALKDQLKDFEGDQAETIRRQAQLLRHKDSEMYRANDKADKALARAKHLEKRVAELEKLGIAV